MEALLNYPELTVLLLLFLLFLVAFPLDSHGRMTTFGPLRRAIECHLRILNDP